MRLMLPINGNPRGPGIGLLQALLPFLYKCLPQAWPPGCAQKHKAMASQNKAMQSKMDAKILFWNVKDLHLEARAKTQKQSILDSIEVSAAITFFFFFLSVVVTFPLFFYEVGVCSLI